MQTHRVLYVIDVLQLNTMGLPQAVALNGDEQALSLVAVYPEIPSNYDNFARSYQRQIESSIEKNILTQAAEQGIGAASLSINVIGAQHAAQFIKEHVAEYDFNYLVKGSNNRQQGFDAFERTIARMAPCPVYLAKAPQNANNAIIVAIDAEPINDNEQRLAARIMSHAIELARQFKQQLHVVSCWNFPLAEFASENIWYKSNDAQAITLLRQYESENHEALNHFLEQFDISGLDLKIHHKHGSPSTIIPKLAEAINPTRIVLGTVARSGISGALIGSTAESLLTTLAHSCILIKPE